MSPAKRKLTGRPASRPSATAVNARDEAARADGPKVSDQVDEFETVEETETVETVDTGDTGTGTVEGETIHTGSDDTVRNRDDGDAQFDGDRRGAVVDRDGDLDDDRLDNDRLDDDDFEDDRLDDDRLDEDDVEGDDLDEDENLREDADDDRAVGASAAGTRAGGHGARPGRPMKEKTGIFHRLYHGTTNIDFIGMKNKWFIFSLVVILVSLGSLLFRPMNFGIDFRGGSSWEVPTRMEVGQVRAVLDPLGYGNAKIQRLGDGLVRVQGDVRGDTAEEREGESKRVRDALAQATGTEVSVSTVGPSWGGEITRKALIALAVFFLVIFIYLMLRFEWRLAAGALAAVVHDILVTIGVYALTGLEVTPASVIAFLTILGFSLYDTVVVFDKLDENTKGLGKTGRYRYSDIVNLSLNQTLMRSLNTSLVAVLPILSVLIVGSLILGAKTLEDFGVALLIGLLTGAYSSVFIATPLVAVLKEGDPKWRGVREQLDAKGVPRATPGEMMAAAQSPVSNRTAAGPRGRTTVAPTGRRQAPTGRLVLARAEGDDFVQGHDQVLDGNDLEPEASATAVRAGTVNYTKTSRQGGGRPAQRSPRVAGKGKAKSKGKSR